MKTGGRAEVELRAFLTTTPHLCSGQLQYLPLNLQFSIRKEAVWAPDMV